MHPATTMAETLPEKALRYLGLHPENPATWVLAALSRKYDLDPLLNEVAVIGTKQGLRPYITRDGLLSIAHRSGQFDGMTTDDLHEGEHGWGATVTVWRKDMSHGFTYSAGCGRNEPQAQQGHGPEMALARAERRALHRAFNVPTTGGDWDAPPDMEQEPQYSGASAPQEAAIARSPAEQRATFIAPTDEQQTEIRRLFHVLGLAASQHRATRLALIREATDREVTTTAELDREDCALLISYLSDAIQDEEDERQRLEHEQDDDGNDDG
jgi:hypothetical protein